MSFEGTYLMDASEQAPEQKPAPWGLWATIGFSCAIGIILFVVQAATAVGFVVLAKFRAPEADIGQIAGPSGMNGSLVTLAILVSAPIAVGLTLLFAGIRRGITLRQYFRWQSIPRSQILNWCLLLLVFLVGAQGFGTLLNRPEPEFMINAYRTAGCVPLLWFVIIVLGPAAEELFFRGFMFAGIQNSGLGSLGAMTVTSLVWAVIHFGQYDLFEIATLFFLGLLFGFARARSNSIHPAIVMHMLLNLIASIQVTIYLKCIVTGT